jgi:hypothetical protein
MKELGPYALGQHATARAFLGSVPEQGLNEFLLGRDFGEGQVDPICFTRGIALAHSLRHERITAHTSSLPDSVRGQLRPYAEATSDDPGGRERALAVGVIQVGCTP